MAEWFPFLKENVKSIFIKWVLNQECPFGKKIADSLVYNYIFVHPECLWKIGGTLIQVFFGRHQGSHMAYDPVVLGEWLRINMACQLLYQTHFFVIDHQLPSGNIVLAIRVFPQETAKLLESTRGYDQNESLSNIRLYSVTINKQSIHHSYYVNYHLSITRS